MATTTALTEDTAFAVLKEACDRAGVDASGAELIRLGSNAVYRLASPVIVRISRDADTTENVARQVAVAHWLEDQNYPATRALPVEQPVDVNGHVASFWVSVSERVKYAPIGQVAELIRDLHALRAPTDVYLPPKRPFVELYDRMSHLANLESDDANFIRRKVEVLSNEYDSLSFDLPKGPIHGDANVGNVILSRDGTPVLIDLDSFAIGPREWDLVQTALFYERFGWHTAEEYRAFVAIYGFDIMEWPGYRTLADYREIAMTLWLCGNAGADSKAATEVHKRIETIRSDGDRRDWVPF